MDFTLKKYKELLQTFIDQGYSFQTFEEFISGPKQKVIVLRHDVDRKAKNALDQAQIEHDLKIKATYYFRIVPQSNNKEVMKEIVSLKHELGYHYEDLTLAHGNYEKAYEQFKFNLNYFRQFYPVTTICMHGSPFSKTDNRDIWKKYNYKDSGIIAEPYFDVNYDDVFYVTDTGRAWNKRSVIIRDKVQSKIDIPIKNIDHFIELAKQNKLPQKIILSTHPHRWFNVGPMWFIELISQNIKNSIKALIVGGDK